MNESIHAALWEWFSGCASITKLFFNFGEAEDDSTVIATSGDVPIEKYIDGSQLRRYSFELIRFLPASHTANDAGNIAMMEDVEQIAEWVRARSEADELPALPPGCQALSAEVLDSEGGYVAAENENTAKYMIPMAIEYLKE